MSVERRFEFPGCLARFANLAAKVHSRLLGLARPRIVCADLSRRRNPRRPTKFAKRAAIRLGKICAALSRDFGTGSPFGKPEGYLRPERCHAAGQHRSVLVSREITSRGFLAAEFYQAMIPHGRISSRSSDSRANFILISFIIMLAH